MPPSEGLRARAQRALQEVSHGKKSPGTSFPADFQEHDPTVSLSPPLGLGRWDSPGLSPVEVAGTASGTPGGQHGTSVPNRYARIFTALESGCPDLVPVDRWRAAVQDGQRFLTRWGDQAEALGWTARDLFGLDRPPEKPHPSYSRRRAHRRHRGDPELDRCDHHYRRFNKPALGPLGDSLDDLESLFGGSAA
jgi:hypothetical protein